MPAVIDMFILLRRQNSTGGTTAGSSVSRSASSSTPPPPSSTTVPTTTRLPTTTQPTTSAPPPPPPTTTSAPPPPPTTTPTTTSRTPTTTETPTSSPPTSTTSVETFTSYSTAFSTFVTVAPSTTEVTLGYTTLTSTTLAPATVTVPYSTSAKIGTTTTVVSVQQTPSPSPDGSGGLSTGAKAGIGAGVGVIFLALLVLGLWCGATRKSRRDSRDGSTTVYGGTGGAGTKRSSWWSRRTSRTNTLSWDPNAGMAVGAGAGMEKRYDPQPTMPRVVPSPHAGTTPSTMTAVTTPYTDDPNAPQELPSQGSRAFSPPVTQGGRILPQRDHRGSYSPVPMAAPLAHQMHVPPPQGMPVEAPGGGMYYDQRAPPSPPMGQQGRWSQQSGPIPSPRHMSLNSTGSIPEGYVGHASPPMGGVRESTGYEQYGGNPHEEDKSPGQGQQQQYQGGYHPEQGGYPPEQGGYHPEQGGQGDYFGPGAAAAARVELSATPSVLGRKV